MQTAMQAFVAAPTRALSSQPRARKSVAVSCSAQNERTNFIAHGARTLAVGIAAATLFAGVPSAEAGVILSKSSVKNLVNDTPAAPVDSAPAAKKVSTKSPPAAAGDPDAFEVKVLVFPISLLAIAGGAAAVSALDPEFVSLMREWGAKDSNLYAGYEPNLKETPFFGVPGGSIPTSLGGAKTAAAAAKKPAAAAKKPAAAAKKQGGLGGLGGLFGKK